MLIDLEQQECERLLTLLAKYVTWELANPLIVKINKQMQQQTPPPLHKGNSDDVATKSKTR